MLSHPGLILLVAAVVVAVAPRRVGTVVLLSAPVIAFAALLGIDRDDPGTVWFFGHDLHLLRLDDLSATFSYVFLLATFIAALYGTKLMTTAERVSALAYAGTGISVVLAGDLLALFLAWEMKALAAAALIAFRRDEVSGPASFRYLVVHVASGSVLLGGIIWHVWGGNSLAFDAFDPSGAAYLILVAVLLSAAVPPLHSWLPDAYPAASIAGTVILSTFTTKAAIYTLARGFPGFEVLIWLGVAGALVGVTYAILENDIRRLLSYHIVSQIGFMVVGVGIGTTASLNGSAAHAFAHIIYKGLLLMGVGAVIYATGRSKLSDLGGLAKVLPAVMVLYMVGAVSISAFPLFSGFVSKEMIVGAAGDEHLEVVVLLLKLASVGTFLSTALKLPWCTWGGPARQITVRPIPATMYAAMGLAAFVNVAIGVQPQLLYDVLPFAVDYTPYTAKKLLETTEVLLFTGLAYWVLMRKLGGEPKISLDTDWAYRGAPKVLAGPLSGLRERVPPVGTRLGDRLGGFIDTTPLVRLRPGPAAASVSAQPSPVVPTAALGAVALCALLVVVTLSVLT